LIVDSCDVTMM